MNILGLDPGFAACGYAVARHDEHGITPLKLGVWRSKPDRKAPSVAADNVARARLLHCRLSETVKQHDVRMVAAEAMVGNGSLRGARAGMVGGLAWGVIVSVMQSRGLHLVQVRAQEVKRALGVASTLDGESPDERRERQKAETEAVLRARFHDVPFDAMLADLPHSQYQHVFDALAVVVAASEMTKQREAA